MSWKRHFSPVTLNSSHSSPIAGNNFSTGPAKKNYSSYLPDVYTGSPNRVERYMQYESMDSDGEVSGAMDILAEFCTQPNKENQTPFILSFTGDPTGSEVRVLREYLQQWSKLQEYEIRMFRMARNLFKYGDIFFIRDPETQKFFYIDPGKIVKIIVNESEGKKPEQYVIRDLNVNFINLVTTQISPNTQNIQPGGAAYASGGSGARGMTGAYPQQSGSRFSMAQNEFAVDAKHVVHISLSEGLDNYYPFGQSLLENVFKVYKQKELLEDAILIYRVQRAPERRVFYIDVGSMPSHLAMGFVERVKNEIHQRRIPSSTGGSSSVVDSSYNPLCLDLETAIPLLDGRVLSLQEIIDEFDDGKENWAYSCDPKTGRLVPGLIDWAGITRQNTDTIKVTLSTGKSFICTPDHKVPTLNRGYVEAKDLKDSDNLIAFNTKRKLKDENSFDQYEQYWDYGSATWKFTHETIADFFHSRLKHQEYTYLTDNEKLEKNIILHMDSNLLNNSPINLYYMSEIDYNYYRNVHNYDFWENIVNNTSDRYSLRMAHRVFHNWDKLTDTDRRTAYYNIMTSVRNKPIPMKSERTIIKYDPIKIEKVIVSCVNQYDPILNKFNKTITDMVLNFIAKRPNIKTTVDFVEAGAVDNDLTSILYDKKIYNNGPDSPGFEVKQESAFNSKALADIAKENKHDNSFIKVIHTATNGIAYITNIETVPNRNVGTITIDGTEKWHNFHNFAIDAGVYVKNSINEDFFFPVSEAGRGSRVETLPGGCFSMDTSVSLLDGRELSIKDIGKELELGKELWTYSCEPLTGKIVPGLITWAGITQESAYVMRLTLDNGETIICTPDHKFPTYEQEYIRAGNMIAGQSLIPLRRRTSDDELGYEELFDNSKQKWVYTHRVVSTFFNNTNFNFGKTVRTTNYLDNHQVVKIECLDEPIQVGTLCIDNDEIYHGYHTFALSVGVQTFNSNIGEISDLQYFTNKLLRTLKIPSSYLPTGADDGNQQYNDGRVGTAYIQELRFNKYCERLQNLMTPAFDREFKVFLSNKGVNIDFSLFTVRFPPPQNFASYRQAELDNQRISTFSQLAALPFVSKRYALKRFLGFSEEDLAENERLWKEENGDKLATNSNSSTEMRSLGITPSGLSLDQSDAMGGEAPDDMMPQDMGPEDGPSIPSIDQSPAPPM